MKINLLIIGLAIFLIFQSFTFTTTSNMIEEDCFGFILKYTPEQSYGTQRNISILINKLLNQNASIFWTCENISVLSKKTPYGNDTAEIRFFQKGSILIAFTGNSNIDTSCTSLLYEYNLSRDIEIYHILQELTNLNVFVFNEPKIVHYDIISISSILYYNRLKEGGFLYQDFLSMDKIVDDLNIDNYNVVIMGGQAGHFDIIARDNFNIIALKAKQKIREFVSSGGGYVSSCHGSAMASSGPSHPYFLPRDLTYLNSPILINLFNIKLIDRKVYRALPGGGGAYLKSGSGVSVRVVNKSNPVSFGLPEIIDNHEYLMGPMFLDKKSGAKSNTDSLAVIEGIDREGWDWDFGMENVPLWNIKLIPKSFRNEIFNKWVDYSIGKTLWVTAKYGDGKVISFGGHPEYPYAKSPPRIVYNAVFYAASEGPKNVDLKISYSFLSLKVDANGPYVTTTANPEIQFEGSINPKENISYCWCWSFGNGTLSFEQKPIHIYSYNKSKEYIGVLSVVSDNKEMGIDTTTISIKDKLTADLSPDYGTFNVNESILFSDLSYGGFPPYQWFWKFGDNKNSTLQNPEHTYTKPEFFKGNLIIKDSKNVENIHSFLIAINNITSYKADLEIEGDNGTTNCLINFTADVKRSINDDSFKYLYEFRFGDGSEPLIIGPITDTKITVNHSYNNLGTYYPTVCITNFSSEGKQERFYTVTKVKIDNKPPDKPKIPIGPTIALKFFHHKYIASGSDPDGDKLEFKFDWGDGFQTPWMSYDWYPNEKFKIIHGPWYKHGNCEVRVKTRDKYKVESPWSDPLVVKVI